VRISTSRGLSAGEGRKKRDRRKEENTVSFSPEGAEEEKRPKKKKEGREEKRANYSFFSPAYPREKKRELRRKGGEQIAERSLFSYLRGPWRSQETGKREKKGQRGPSF